jgi:hypothetical protein
MKPENSSAGKSTAGSRRASSVRMMPQLPMEWMDPMSWRLPSGKALAEFALQAGFLAPLMLGSPTLKRKRPRTDAVIPAGIDKQVGEAPERPATFREIR